MNTPHLLVEFTGQHPRVTERDQELVEGRPRTADADGPAVWRTNRLRAIAGPTVGVGLAVAAVVLLAGCSGEAATVAVPASSPVSTAPSSSVAVPTPVPAPTAVAAPTPVAVPTPVAPVTPKIQAIPHDADVVGNAFVNSVSFATPSGNIGCMMYEEAVRCDVLENSWSVPPTPSDCEFDFGISVELIGTGKGALGCISDTVTSANAAVLGYGKSVELDGTICVSRQTGLRCHNKASGHGFTVSRASYTLF